MTVFGSVLFGKFRVSNSGPAKGVQSLRTQCRDCEVKAIIPFRVFAKIE